MMESADKTKQSLPRLHLRDRQLYDLEVLLVGGFAPLTSFMNEEEYESVVETMRLPSGKLFPIPIVLDVPETYPYKVGDQVVLCDPEGIELAVLTIESKYKPDKLNEVKKVYGTDNTEHPGVAYVRQHMHDTYIGGSIKKIALPQHDDFTPLRHTPEELKAIFKKKGWDQVIGFQTRNPMHRAHFEVVKRAHEKVGAPVLVHPVVGMTKPGDVDYVTRVHTYEIICGRYAENFTQLSLLPLAMRMAGPREALWHAIIRKNYGCTHFICGRDHAGPGKNSADVPFYEPFAARDLLFNHADEIDIVAVDADELAYSKRAGRYVTTEERDHDDEPMFISGTEFRRMIREGEEIPEWFSFPEVVEEVRRAMRGT